MLGGDNYAFLKETEHGSRWMSAIQEKKPFTNDKMQEYASNGTYYFKSGKIVKKYFQELVDKNIQINNEFYVSMVYQLMCEDNMKIRIFEIEKMLQWGTPKDLEEYVVWSDYFLHRNICFQHGYRDQQNTTLILPMAGAGSRFFSVGYTTPKPLLEVEGVPMVVKAVGDLPDTTHKIFICQNEHLESYDIQRTVFSKYFESKFIGIDYVTEGQACTCELAFKLGKIQSLESPVMISACDNGVYYDMNAYIKLVNDPDVDIIVWSFSNNPTSQLYPHMYAWLDVDENQYIRRVSIKKPFDDCENKYAIIGTMLFKKGSYFLKGLNKIYHDELRTNGEFYVDNMIEPLVNMGYKCKIFNVDNYLCWGTPNDYKTYNY
jgi:bifunctional N-acetylglucosamine-1-phosphate-uridyltransferase/glucosamine-1-phosphate-acetyltransferase GlmU-like protein